MKPVIVVHRNILQAEYAKTIILEATKNLLNYGVVSHELCY